MVAASGSFTILDFRFSVFTIPRPHSPVAGAVGSRKRQSRAERSKSRSDPESRRRKLRDKTAEGFFNFTILDSRFSVFTIPPPYFPVAQPPSIRRLAPVTMADSSAAR